MLKGSRHQGKGSDCLYLLQIEDFRLSTFKLRGMWLATVSNIQLCQAQGTG